MGDSRPVVAGIGETAVTPPDSGRAGENLALEAAAQACHDAGLLPHDVDGVVKYTYDSSISAMSMAATLGFGDLNLAVEVPHGGGSSAALLDVAAMAVASGRAKGVLCFRTIVATDWLAQLISADPLRPYYLETVRYLRPVGWAGYLHLFAALYEEYRHRYGISREVLLATGNMLRANALASGSDISIAQVGADEYFSAPQTVGPFTAFDEFTPADLSCAILVTAQGATSFPSREVEVFASAQSQGPDPKTWFDLRPFSSSYPESPSSWVADKLYRTSGLSPENIDMAGLYDCTTFTPLDLLEQFRLCAPGEVSGLVADKAFLATGRLPMNTNGGDFAGGYSHGFRHLLEAVRQLRSEAANQVPEPEFALVAAPQIGPTSGAILRRSDRG